VSNIYIYILWYFLVVQTKNGFMRNVFLFLKWSCILWKLNNQIIWMRHFLCLSLWFYIYCFSFAFVLTYYQMVFFLALTFLMLLYNRYKVQLVSWFSMGLHSQKQECISDQSKWWITQSSTVFIAQNDVMWTQLVVN
jgi:hypothetical protein